MSLKFTAGDLTIHRLIEEETTFLPVHDLFAGLTPDLLAENRRWLRDSGAIDATDTLILCFQSYVVRTPHHTILIDSCIGNDEPRPQRPKWNQKTDDTYMRALKAAGFAVDGIDFVMCTHLHVDHVGWNTRLEGGRWFPTFPKARYAFGKAEYDYWAEQHAKAEVPPFGDSVLPVVEAAVDAEFDTRDEAGLLGCQKSYGRGNLVRTADTPNRDHGYQPAIIFAAFGLCLPALAWSAVSTGRD